MIDDKEALLVLRTIDEIRSKLERGVRFFKYYEISTATKIDKNKVIEIVKYLFDKGLVVARFPSADNVGILTCFVEGLTAYGNDFLKEQLKMEEETNDRNSETKTDLELIQSLIEMIDKVPEQDLVEIDNLIKKTEMYLKNLYPDSSNEYIKNINSINFSPMVTPTTHEEKQKKWESGKKQFKLFLERIIEEKNLFEKSEKRGEKMTVYSNKIFIVHGHDGEMKHHAARVIQDLGLEPIILHEQPDEGRTIIEKFSDYSDVGFAIILLSPDDFGYKKDLPKEKRLRARQNVILEMGFFLGKLERKNVFLLVKNNNIEIPSDYTGVIFVPYESQEDWRLKLVQSLKTCGYKVTADALIK